MPYAVVVVRSTRRAALERREALSVKRPLDSVDPRLDRIERPARPR
jgi:hypothetical protein